MPEKLTFEPAWKPPENTFEPVPWTNKPLPTIQFLPTTKKPNTAGPVVPENFGFVSSKVFEVNGEKHEQSVFYDARKKEAILFSPAHAGYPDITTVLTSKKGNQKAQSLTCDNKVCHLNDVQDELFMNPEVIAAVYVKKEEDMFQGRPRRPISSPITKTKYVVRSDHRALDEKIEITSRKHEKCWPRKENFVKQYNRASRKAKSRVFFWFWQKSIISISKCLVSG